VSAHELKRADSLARIGAAVRGAGLPADRLVFELTESVLIDDFAETLRKLERLKSFGVRLAIDDFGTKYSSLAYLKKLPIDRLKIDKLFLKDFPGDPGSVEITTAIIAICRSLGLEVIAEGVETEEQVGLLREKGCRLIQGHYYSKPLSPESLLPFMRGHLP
jgi:EAL domain-containing protein (putative c-di-GMP-specific phosphodiesterase class I)